METVSQLGLSLCLQSGTSYKRDHHWLCQTPVQPSAQGLNHRSTAQLPLLVFRSFQDFLGFPSFPFTLCSSLLSYSSSPCSSPHFLWSVAPQSSPPQKEGHYHPACTLPWTETASLVMSLFKHHIISHPLPTFSQDFAWSNKAVRSPGQGLPFSVD